MPQISNLCKPMDHYNNFVMNKILVDPFERRISYLRLSVTDRCDFRCVYCMSENMTFLPKKDLLTLEELDKLSTAFINLGVKKLRITGGEPLVRRDIMSFFDSVGRHLDSGNYYIRTIMDTNNNKVYDTGNYLKKIQPERVLYYPTILEIRVGWDYVETFILN